jgi:hypothetical protein
MNNNEIYYDWSFNTMLQIELNEPDDFLKIKETLTRIGIASKKDNKLYQSCHILQKQGLYYIVHFKELFILDGKDSDISLSDIERRNAIAGLLEDWGLLKILSVENSQPRSSLSQIKVLSFKEKNDWELVTKYNLGKKR